MKINPRTLNVDGVTTDSIADFTVNFYFARFLGLWMIVASIVLFGPAINAYQNYQKYEELGGSSLEAGYVHHIKYDIREHCAAIETVGAKDIWVLDTGKSLRKDDRTDPRCTLFAMEIGQGWQDKATSLNKTFVGDFFLAAIFALFILVGAFLMLRTVVLFICLILQPLFPYYRQITLLLFLVPMFLMGVLVYSNFQLTHNIWQSNSNSRPSTVYVTKAFIDPVTNEVFVAPNTLQDWANKETMKPVPRIK